MPILPLHTVRCPYCGESIEVAIDDSIERQQYIEDCSVCCRPIEIEVAVDPDSGVDVVCRTENDA